MMACDRRGRGWRIRDRRIWPFIALAIRRVVVGSGEFKSLEIEELTMRPLHAAEVIVSGSLEPPEAMSIATSRHE